MAPTHEREWYKSLSSGGITKHPNEFLNEALDECAKLSIQGVKTADYGAMTSAIAIEISRRKTEELIKLTQRVAEDSKSFTKKSHWVSWAALLVAVVGTIGNIVFSYQNNRTNEQ